MSRNESPALRRIMPKLYHGHLARAGRAAQGQDARGTFCVDMPLDQPISLITLASLALLVRVGMASWSAGMMRSKNAAAAGLRSVCELSLAALAFFAIGAAFLEYEGTKIIGINPRLILDLSN